MATRKQIGTLKHASNHLRTSNLFMDNANVDDEEINRIRGVLATTEEELDSWIMNAVEDDE